ncbi:MAG: hypothetical protein ABL933_02400 [Methyloglobulus sp.]|nr:hypothetical protein [Methyloglobulus sp.]
MAAACLLPLALFSVANRRAPYFYVMHNLVFIAVTAIIILAFCQPGPTTNELASKYKSNPEGFEKLSRLIKEDTGSKSCFVVGLDNIGDYWEYMGKWAHPPDSTINLSLAEVLKVVGLTQDRYAEYKQLFSSTGSERISFCHAQKYVPQDRVTVLVYRSGLAVSGCSGTINWMKTNPNSKHDKDNSTKITELGNGWYLEYKCT